MLITLNDWRGQRATVPIQSLTVVHAPDSDGIATIGTPINNGDGTFSVPITAGTRTGTDRFRVTANDGNRPVVLAPNPALRYFAVGDLNCDGAMSFADINPFALALTGQAEYHAAFPDCNRDLADCNLDGTVSFADINPFVTLLSGG